MFWKIRHALRRLGVLGFSLGALLMSHVALAEGLSVIRTVYLEHGAIVDPKAIARAHDNGFIIAGSIDRPNQPRSAWATKTDAGGNVLWRYTVPLREKLRINDGPEFTSAAIMPDGSVFLCGRMPLAKGGSALLTHLDKGGKLLSEELLKPAGLDAGGFNACIAWNDGIAAVGLTGTSKHVKPTASHPLPYDAKYFYWIVSLDKEGKVKSEQLQPIASRIVGFPDGLSPLQPTTDGGLVFIGTRHGFGTEIVHINATSEVAASRTLDKDFVLIQSLFADKQIRLLSTQTESLSLITLDSDLKETGGLTRGHTIGEVDMAYLLPDHSLIIFGARHDKDGLYYGAQVMSVDAQLKSEQTVLLGEKLESGWARAGIPLEVSGECVAVRSAIKHSNLGIHATDEQWDKVRLGAAMDFIQLK